MRIDINCDLGELSLKGMENNDELIMKYITSANIACGFHTGDPLTMSKTLSLAKKYNTGVGAHPGYPDREEFGRKPLAMSNEELRASILYQVGALKTIAETIGLNLQHVKPHGALYNSAASDYGMALVIAQAVKDIDSSLILVGLSGSEMRRAAIKTGLQFASEVFADRAYNDDGSLMSRQLRGAVLTETDIVVDRAVKMIKDKSVVTCSGQTIHLEADTICIHGDNHMAPQFAMNLKRAFTENGIDVIPMGRK